MFYLNLVKGNGIIGLFYTQFVLLIKIRSFKKIGIAYSIPLFPNLMGRKTGEMSSLIRLICKTKRICHEKSTIATINGFSADDVYLRGKFPRRAHAM